MNAEMLSRRWFLCSITYFVIGIGLGVFMGASGNHSLFPAHAHINLLGWALMGLTGLLYRSGAVGPCHLALLVVPAGRASDAARGGRHLLGLRESRAGRRRGLGSGAGFNPAFLVGDFLCA